MKQSQIGFSPRPNLKLCFALGFLIPPTTQLNFGLTESYSSLLDISNPLGHHLSTLTTISVAIALAYTLSALNILKYRYMYIAISSYDSLSNPAYKPLTTLLTTLYLNLDSFLLTLFSTLTLQPQVALYTLINQDLFLHTILITLTLTFKSQKRPKNIKFPIWKTVKNTVIILILYFQILLTKLLNQHWLSGLFLLPSFLVSTLIDWKNDTIMNRAYKMMGVVAEDESFDIDQ
jgi:hypothetical protein